MDKEICNLLFYLFKLKDTMCKPFRHHCETARPKGMPRSRSATSNHIKKSSYRDLSTSDFLMRFKSLIVQHWVAGGGVGGGVQIIVEAGTFPKRKAPSISIEGECTLVQGEN